jgi:hypothetical protein
MRTRSADDVFSQYASEVEVLIDAGRPFSEVEAALDGSGLSEDWTSALWLLAWSKARQDLRGARPAVLLEA